MHTQTLAIRLLENSLEFKPRKWAGKLLGAGCYPYAANFYCETFIRIGEFIGTPCDMQTSDNELVRALAEELLYIGYRSVEEVSIDYDVNPGEQKIYLQRSEQLRTYHMFRQNGDGLWSHKYRNKLPMETDYEKRPIRNPERQSSEDNLKYYGWCFLLKRD